MPHEGEVAPGDSLLSLHGPEAFKEFKARVRRDPVKRDPPEMLDVPRNPWRPRRIIAVDGSNISEPLRNGFPMAEASLLKISVVSLDVARLMDIRRGDIPPPDVFTDMEQVHSFDKILPGANVDRPEPQGDTPRRFFRESVYEAFNSRIDRQGETLLDTLRAVEQGKHDASGVRCPLEGCTQRLSRGRGAYRCACPDREKLFETDALRLWERFSEVSTNGEAFGEVRHVLEVLTLLNVLRIFCNEEDLDYLRENVFVLDGPLALFAHAAWLAPLVRAELRAINGFCRRHGGFDLAVFGFEKSGQFVEHFERLDFSDEAGPRSRLPDGTVIAPTARYINRNITLRPDGKMHGRDTYFGRKIFYKTRTGGHAVITTGMVNQESEEFESNRLDCYPRLGDMLNVLDQLSTYLYHDGFMPLVRAHAHAAIPLGRGGGIIRSLFDDEPRSGFRQAQPGPARR